MNREQRDARQLLHETLSRDAYLSVNKKLIQLTNIETAIYLADILSKEKYFADRGQLNDEGFFFNTQNDIEYDTTLSAYQQRQCVQKLQSIDIITTKRSGMPARTFIKINHVQLLSFLISSSEVFSDHTNNKYTNLSSKEDNKDAKASKSVQKSIYVDEWNKKENLRKHLKPETKVFQASHKYCRYLKAGQLHRLGIDKEFMNRFEIPAEWLTRKWTDEEIFESFNRIALMHSEAYLPVDKKVLPKNLSDFIFNWQTGNSFFLSVMKNPPKLRGDAIKVTDQHPDITALYLEMFNKFHSKRVQTQLDTNKLVRAVSVICRRHGEILEAIEANGPGAKTHFGTVKAFVRHHSQYLISRFEDKLSVADITRSWVAFLEYVRREYDWDFTISGEDLVKKQKIQEQRAKEFKRVYSQHANSFI